VLIPEDAFSPHFERRAVERCLDRRGASIRVPHFTNFRASEGTSTAFFHRWSANLYFGKDEGEAKEIEGDAHEELSFNDPQLADESSGHVGNVAFAVIADFDLVPLSRAKPRALHTAELSPQVRGSRYAQSAAD
jgi:hypothetical protein